MKPDMRLAVRRLQGRCLLGIRCLDAALVEPYKGLTRAADCDHMFTHLDRKATKELSVTAPHLQGTS